MTIYDIAEKAKVSPATVSRVINDAPNVASSTRKRIETIIDQLAFEPNASARSLAQSKINDNNDK